MFSLLYIDDEPGLLEIGKLFLESAGEFSVTTAQSADEGLALLARRDFDAVVSDFQMPGMDGIELLKAVRRSFGNIPFILFTGRGREEVVIEAINNGVDFYLQKGGDPKVQFVELAHKIRQSISRRQAEQAHGESEKRFRELADLLPQGIYEADRNGRMIYVNRLALEMSGYTTEDIATGINAMDVIAPVDRKRAAAVFGQMAKQGTRIPGSAEYTALRKDGSTFPVSIFSSPVIRDGGIVGIRGVIMDITEQKKVEEELRAANEQLAASGEELQAQYDELAASEMRIRASETRLSYMLGFYEYAQAGEKELLRYAIEGAGIVTGSPLGYLAFLNGDESELSMYAWSASAMAECAIRDKPIVYKTAKTGLWGEAVRQRRPVITNNYAAPDPAKKGYPEGHPHITRHMNVPVIEDGHIVLLAGVANKPADYTDHDTSELLLLMQGLWSILKRKQVQEEQKRAYDQLKRSEEELRLLKISVDQSADEVFWLDFAGNILYVNDAACRVNGYSPDEFRTMTIYDLNPDITPAIWAGSVADLRQRKTQLITTRHRHRDGVTIDVEIMAVYVNRDGDEYSFAFVRDITGRKQAESAVRESGRKYEELFELGSEAIFLIDNETGALLEANAAACDMYGYSRDMLLSMKNTDLSAEKEETRKVTGESPAGIVRVPLRYHRRRNGTVFPVEIIGRFFTWNGRPVHIAAIRDITERQQAEAAIRETNRKLNLLNSITRHDIRNQLMIAQGYAQLAALNKPDPAVAGLLAGISTAVETIQHQIEFTREYQELGVRAPVWIRAGDIIRGAGTEKIRLTCTCDAVEIYADPMIDKVFFNLFDNAVKHGTRVTDIVAGCEERACGLVITFADNGIGIPDEEKEKIFEKGYGKNTGFGLFLVREILAITGITIRETGTSGTGAVFEIVVPEGSYRIGK